MTKALRNGGFTLIELLTVIAIIAILAAMTFSVGPRIIERAKLASLANDFNQTRTACVSFYTKNRETYPPAYGYKVYDPHKENPGRVFKPYVAEIGFFRVMDIYDRFSMNGDTDMNGRISLLEFSPTGTKSGPDSYSFTNEIYTGDNLSGEVNRQLSAEKRPLIYIPVNLKQAKVVAQYYYDLAQTDPQAGWYAERWAKLPNGTAKNDVTKLEFPPTKYDDYVLISVGPAGNTGGILTPPPSFVSDLGAFGEENWYHILALRAYFLALRDANDNGLLDFDYQARKEGEGKEASYADIGPGLHLLPDGTPGQGPVIYHNTGS